ncbi:MULTISPECIES: GTP-binding protein [unclassified Mucilaginibacter]|uniref:sulfate adenylyltransferase subunit 1 n=1 Tax=unclassified Mucilaginibacter TaxID=2617802 RepID=UPI002AC94E9A|nr:MULTISPECIES: GTP-binding protein [unclassified Mucilaginibacter]MEB0261257.1 GTP-binding protein [Mucilaginibacter sp. 10I4]MEB0279081.1 GTP-binding protein [Mucilaginibacter sp. 10B2]MEB0299900.1 GTP-binding protein [Mucilaginibacter sp. 5C4]WPX22259.1 GTP-binding protein [Mucilaginibacter sp. 5C4]
MDILKFITAGSVDDGKSTLIGRLLYDSEAILADQLEALHASNRKNDDGTIDLAILTDGLKAEREQGITIDVAYKYFETDKRKFIIADAPGHIQYTRNMVTGASNAALAIILIDARKGVIEQTTRHSFLVSLLQISKVVVAVNKMDMVDYNEEVFNNIVADFKKLAAKVDLDNVTYIPVSALKGDNIVYQSSNISWYTGDSLLQHLENVEIVIDDSSAHARLPVQWVIRPQTDELHDYRGYAGRVSSGSFKVNDKVTILPSGFSSTISKIELYDKNLEEALAGTSVTVHLSDNIDISRGDIIVNSAGQPQLSNVIEADLCWMDTRPLDTTMTYLVQHNTKTIRCKIQEVIYKVNINTLEKEHDEDFKLNDIGRIVIKTAEPLAFDPYQVNKANGGAIIIDSRTNVTVGALMLRQSVE